MNVSHERTLFVSHVGYVRVSRIKAGSCRIGITRVSGKNEVMSKVEQSQVSPVTRVKLLPMQQQMVRCGSRIQLRREICHVWDALLFVHDEVFDNPQVFSRGLLNEMRRSIPISPGIVHMHMNIA